jgi:hypothetical protein
MTQITNDHVEWAVVDRLRCMLEGPPHKIFNVTETYALFTTIICWVVQRIRIPTHEINTGDDRIAHKLFKTLSRAAIADDPWRIPVTSAERIESMGSHKVVVPASSNFETHTVDRFLINLRDATAHGDARNVSPFNVPIGSERLLAGFSFACAETRARQKTWEGKITLLEGDMRRIGGHLAKIYCDALRRSDAHRHDSHFANDAARSVREAPA